MGGLYKKKALGRYIQDHELFSYLTTSNLLCVVLATHGKVVIKPDPIQYKTYTFKIGKCQTKKIYIIVNTF